MIENNPTNVTAAFEMLLEEIEDEINFVNKTGTRGFEKPDYGQVKEALERAEALTGFRSKVVGLRKEWEALTAVDIEPDDEQPRSERQNLGRLQRGLRTGEEQFYQPILQALSELGGSARMSAVHERLERSMKGLLKEVDYEPLPSDPKSQRWRNTAQWARNSMVGDGLLKDDSPRGFWEISEKGWSFLKG